MKNTLIFLSLNGIILFSLSCNKYSEVPIPNGSPIIVLKDSTGNNLLDPEYENAFDTKSIRIYYIRDGKEKLQANNVWDNMYFYEIIEYENEYAICIIVDSSEKQTMTLVKWNEFDTDTLICYNKGGRSFTKILYNNELKWEDPSARFKPYFTIIK